MYLWIRQDIFEVDQAFALDYPSSAAKSKVEENRLVKKIDLSYGKCLPLLKVSICTARDRRTRTVDASTEESQFFKDTVH